MSLVKIESGKDDTVEIVEVNIGNAVNGKALPASSGSETMAYMTSRLHGNPGGTLFLSNVKRVCRTTEEVGRQIRQRESDSLIVPLKAGNAAGGKGATHGSAE